MSKIVLRSPYQYDTDKASNEAGIDCSFETHRDKYPDENVHQAQQSAADEHNIVNLVDKLVNYGVGREMPVPISSDFVSATDYHTAYNQVLQAGREFMELPAHVRSRFNNDVGEFLDFFNNPDNRDEAAKFGFLAVKEELPTLKVDVVDSVDRRASLALKKAKVEAGEI